MPRPEFYQRGSRCQHPYPFRFAVRSFAAPRRAKMPPRLPAPCTCRPARCVSSLQRFGPDFDHLGPAYRPGPGRPATQQPAYDLAWALRQQHPTWGAGYIRVRLATLLPATKLPSERALQRWFRQQQQPPAPPGRRPQTEAARASVPHGRWQMDAESAPSRSPRSGSAR